MNRFFILFATKATKHSSTSVFLEFTLAHPLYKILFKYINNTQYLEQYCIKIT